MLGMANKSFKSGSGKTSYPSDVTDEEWAFCAPYLTLMKEAAPQRVHSLREVFNAVRYMVRAGCPWRIFASEFSRGNEKLSHKMQAHKIGTSKVGQKNVDRSP